MQQESFQINFYGSPSAKKRDFSNEFKLKVAKNIFHSVVLIERAYYYAILAEEVRTIR